MPQPIALIIDPDILVSNKLAEPLMDHEGQPEAMTAASIGVAERTLQAENFDWLVIRIAVWGDYQVSRQSRFLYRRPGELAENGLQIFA